MRSCNVLLVTLGVVLSFALSCCGSRSSGTGSRSPDANQGAGARGDSIGEATMRPDGTIVLRLRAEGPDGTIGDAMITYAPDHPRYQAVLDHLGGLEPGQSRPVPPWPDE